MSARWPGRPSRAVVAGRVLSGIAIAFLVFSSSLKFLAPDVVRASLQELGYPPGLGPALPDPVARKDT